MKTVGIIGGLGPETTAEFYLAINFGCYEKNKINRPPVLIWNVPLRYQVEKDLLTKATGGERYIPYLTNAAKRLEDGGADFIVMPCNSLHIFIDEIRKSVKIPVLSIVEETSSFLRKKGIKKVGILATSFLLKSKLYERSLRQKKIVQILPDDLNQAKIGRMISNLVMNRYDNRDRQQLLEIVNKFADKEIKDVILACTDLQLLLPHHNKLHIYDTMKIFADATVDHILE
ncbi:amino acid racemase [Candidatus Parvarchaeota archaeon]|nr:amino acid racemase [Candidatus Parvarchaeota archaeon]